LYALEEAPRGRILIAEDDEVTGKVCSRALTEGGYEVTVASDGRAAFDLLCLARYDLLITDAMMPRVDGFELVRMLRSDEDLRRLPVMFLTANDQGDALCRGYRVGADKFLVKPVKPLDLIEEVDSMMVQASGTTNQLGMATLSGRLDAITVISVLAFLHTQEVSGMLRLIRYGASGCVAIRNGVPINAKVDKVLFHDDALAVLLGWNAGVFRFEPADVSEVPTAFSEPFSELLTRADRIRRAP
jgi:CheY-like chemotaxis protein